MTQLPRFGGSGAGWAGLPVTVLGLDAAGFAAADALLERGAVVTAVDPRSGPGLDERAVILDTLGATVLRGSDAEAALQAAAPRQLDGRLVLVTPPLAVPGLAPWDGEAAVWSEPELAWRLSPWTADPDGRAVAVTPWLALAGPPEHTARVAGLLASMLAAAGRRVAVVGGDEAPVLEAVLHPQPFDVLVVRLEAAQLRHLGSIMPLASATVLVETGDGRDVPLGAVYRNTVAACIYGVGQPWTEEWVRDADVVEGCRAIGVTLGVPAVSMLGLVEDVLCDRAFVEQRQTSAAELATVADVVTALGGDGGGADLLDVLVAAALARAYAVPPVAVRDGLRAHPR